jgi:hypothetical protein
LNIPTIAEESWKLSFLESSSRLLYCTKNIIDINGIFKCMTDSDVSCCHQDPLSRDLSCIT